MFINLCQPFRISIINSNQFIASVMYKYRNSTVTLSLHAWRKAANKRFNFPMLTTKHNPSQKHITQKTCLFYLQQNSSAAIFTYLPNPHCNNLKIVTNVCKVIII